MKKIYLMIVMCILSTLLFFGQDMKLAFTMSDSIVCPGAQITFADVSVNADTTYWLYNYVTDGSDSIITIFNYTGTFLYALVGQKGDILDTIYNAVFVRESLDAEFSAVNYYSWPVTIDEGTALGFKTGWSPGSYDSLKWLVEDSVFSDKLNSSYVFNQADTFNVSLILYGPCANDTVENKVIVSGNDDAPYASISYMNTNDYKCPRTQVSFIHYSKNYDSLLWDFGDGNTSTENEPVHAYDSAGDYVVKLTAFGKDTFSVDSTNSTVFIRDNEMKYLNVYSNPYSYTSCSEDTFSFQLTGGNNISSISWDLGDSTFVEDTIKVKHSFAKRDTNVTYHLKVHATNSCGVVDSVLFDVYIDTLVDLTLTSMSIGDYSKCDSISKQFNIYYSNTSSYVGPFDWDFGNGEKTTTKKNINYIKKTFNDTGDFVLKVIAKNACGVVDTFEQKYTIEEPNFIPSANFYFNQTSCIGDTISFSTDNYSDGTITSSVWHFGDGTSSTKAIPEHKYEKTGYFNVIHEATNLCGNKFVKANTININNFTNLRAWFWTEEQTCPKNELLLDGSWSDSMIYDMGNGDSIVNPEGFWVNYTYNEPGDFLIIQKVFNACGESNAFQNITVMEGPTAEISIDTTVNLSEVSFTNLSENANEYFWKFTAIENDTSMQVNPTFHFSDTGTFNVVLIAEHENGCSDSAIFTILLTEDGVVINPNAIAKNIATTVNIYPNPLRDFSYIDLNGNIANIHSIYVFDINGKVLNSIEINGQDVIRINRNGLKSGLYFLRFQGEQSFTHKLVIK